jgi:hypothetical protein
LLLNVTVAPPAGATFVNVTVHALAAFDPRLVGLQTNELTSTGVTRPIVAGAELPLYVAVTVAV